jgi:hypothetical protein
VNDYGASAEFLFDDDSDRAWVAGYSITNCGSRNETNKA